MEDIAMARPKKNIVQLTDDEVKQLKCINRVEDTPYRVSTPTDSGRADFPHPAPCLMFELLSYKCYGISSVALTDNISAVH